MSEPDRFESASAEEKAALRAGRLSWPDRKQQRYFARDWREKGAFDWTGCAEVEVVPGKVSGVPLLIRSRMPADRVLQLFEKGESPEDIAQLFELELPIVRAVLRFAGATVIDKTDAAEDAALRREYGYLLPRAPETEDPRARELRGPDWKPLTAAAARDRALGCLLGLAAGDAVGTAVEFRERDSFPPLTGMVGGGPFGLKPGEWTDDTTMALCLAESLLAAGTVDQPDFMTRLRAWYERGENSVNGRCFDIGGATRAAIERFIDTGRAAAGSREPDAAGNGSLVRLAPLAIFAAGDEDAAQRLSVRQSRVTHGASECAAAGRLFVLQLLDALSGADKTAAVRPRIMSLPPRLLPVCAGAWKEKARAQIRSSGYVLHTLEAALWSVWRTDNFRDAVLLAANLGDDADSVAAVAGQLAGALYGASGIPPEWRGALAQGDRIADLALALFERSKRRIKYRSSGEEELVNAYAARLGDAAAQALLARGEIRSEHDARILGKFYWRMVDAGADAVDKDEECRLGRVLNAFSAACANAGYGDAWDAETPED